MTERQFYDGLYFGEIVPSREYWICFRIKFSLSRRNNAALYCFLPKKSDVGSEAVVIIRAGKSTSVSNI